jgi:hypothetical protein
MAAKGLLDCRKHELKLLAYLRKNKPAKPSIMKYVGITKGLYGKTAEEVDAYIRQERDSWER